MAGRAAALGATLALIGLLAFLTINVIIRDGFDILVLVSLVILATFSFGVVGALIHPPEE
ncbi:MAG: hypothetical protein WKF49_07255 [Thermoleophilaceae bacterium]|jgi:hypothetical protein